MGTSVMMRCMKPQTRRLVIAVVCTAAILGYALLLWRGPWWIDGSHLRERNLQPADGVVITGVRTMLVALGAGAITGLGLYYTHRNHRHAEKLYEHSQEQFAHVREKDREQMELTHEGQVTERYVEAIKLLGSRNPYERLGGIYSLERIMNDSDRDHRTVVEVLSAFVRTPTLDNGSSNTEATSTTDEDIAQAARPFLAPDVTAALTVLGRQPLRQSHPVTDLRGARLTGAVIQDTDLQDANLQGVELTGARLDSVELAGANLASATLTGASLWDSDLSQAIAPDADFTEVTVVGTKFTHAVLTRALLVGAGLDHADFSHASLSWANLTGACLIKTDLSQASLERADLSGANLEGADLTCADLHGAKLPRADLTGAVLRRADLTFADLTDARLAAADLSTAIGLSAHQLAHAHLTNDTALPQRMAEDLQVRQRIDECEAADAEMRPGQNTTQL
ncbi:pentapeptide repeat-containing protein [Streptomyces chartreusis]|uniref:pentapeptide repeat-containing protein n=1 Tax=Streptomyces chartreusis TaxID=1969 RepID=UPI0036B007F8